MEDKEIVRSVLGRISSKRFHQLEVMTRALQVNPQMVDL